MSDFNPKNVERFRENLQELPGKMDGMIYMIHELVALNCPLRQRSDSKKEQIENHRVYDHNVNHLPRGWSPTIEVVSYPKLSPSQWVYQAVVEHAVLLFMAFQVTGFACGLLGWANWFNPRFYEWNPYVCCLTESCFGVSRTPILAGLTNNKKPCLLKAQVLLAKPKVG